MRRALPVVLLTVVLLLVLSALAVAVRGCDTDALPVAPTSTDEPSDRPAESRERRRVRPSPDAPSLPTSDAMVSPGTETVSPTWDRVDLPRRTLRGVVVDERGAPRDGVLVHLVSTWLNDVEYAALLAHDATSRHVVSSAISSTGGRFSVSRVDGGRAALVAGSLAAPLAVMPVARHDAGGSGEAAAELRLVVPSDPGTLVVTLQRSDGTPEAGARVMLLRDLPWAPSPLSSTAVIPPTTTTNDAGTARFERCAPGLAHIAIEPLGGPPPNETIDVLVRATGETRRVVVLHPIRMLRGVVTSAATGLPLAGAWVEDEASPVRRHATTNAAGRFELATRAVRAEAVRVHVRAVGHTGAVYWWQLDDADGGGSLTAQLEPIAMLRLRCVAPDGPPVPHVTAFVSEDEPMFTNLEWIDLDRVRAGVDVSDPSGRVDIPIGGDARGGEVIVELQAAGRLVASVRVPSVRPGETSEIRDVFVPAPR